MHDLLRILRNCQPVWPGRNIAPRRAEVERFCSGCDTVKPAGSFYATGRFRVDGTPILRSRCKDCEKAAIAERRRG